MPVTSSLWRNFWLPSSAAMRSLFMVSSNEVLDHGRESEGEGGAGAGRGSDPDAALVLPDNRVRHRQAQACALSGSLGGIKRIEDLLHLVVLDARPAVADEDLNDIAAGPGAADNAQNPAARHGLYGVDDDIHYHLIQSDRVAEDRQQA